MKARTHYRPHLLAACMLLLSVNASADFISSAAELKTLLSGNSLYGHYGDMEFRQILHRDGSLTVSIKGQVEALHGQWLINDQGQYCELWPDHQSCFLIGKGRGAQLEVEALNSETKVEIQSHLFKGEIPLDFMQPI